MRKLLFIHSLMRPTRTLASDSGTLFTLSVKRAEAAELFAECILRDARKPL